MSLFRLFSLSALFADAARIAVEDLSAPPRFSVSARTSLSQAIERGWAPVADELIKLGSQKQIFSFQRDVDYLVERRSKNQLRTLSSHSASSHSTQIATDFKVSGSVVSFGNAFAASVHTSTQHARSLESQTATREDQSVSRKYRVILERTSNELVGKLRNRARRDFRNQPADFIYREYGPFRAHAIELGGNIVTTVIRQMSSSESADSVLIGISGSMSTLMAEVAASTEMSVSNVATERAGSTSVSINTAGGDSYVSLSGSDYDAIQDEWSDTITDENLAVTKVELVPLWELIGQLDSAKGEEFRRYCQNKWEVEAADIRAFEDSLRSVTPQVFDRLQPGECLAPGDELTSSSGYVRLVMQTDGNLVIYNGNSARWSSDTHANANAGAHACFQGDGNLVVQQGGRAIWASGIQWGATLVAIQGDCNLVTYRGSRAVWASHSGC